MAYAKHIHVSAALPHMLLALQYATCKWVVPGQGEEYLRCAQAKLVSVFCNEL